MGQHLIRHADTTPKSLNPDTTEKLDNADNLNYIISMIKNYRKFCVTCPQCGKLTSKKYADAHSGQCKACATGSNPANEYGNDGYQQYNEEAAQIRYMENRDSGGDY